MKMCGEIVYRFNRISEMYAGTVYMPDRIPLLHSEIIYIYDECLINTRCNMLNRWWTM